MWTVVLPAYGNEEGLTEFVSASQINLLTTAPILQRDLPSVCKDTCRHVSFSACDDCSMEPTTITTLPGGKFFTLSTDPRRALSESELREELATIIGRADILENI